LCLKRNLPQRAQSSSQRTQSRTSKKLTQIY
jgi:hypothetical protein